MTNRKRTTLGVVHVTATPPGWDKGVRVVSASVVISAALKEAHAL